MKRNAFITSRLGFILLGALVLSLSHLQITTVQSQDQAEDLSKVHHAVFQVLPPPKHLVEELNQAKRDLEHQVGNNHQVENNAYARTSMRVYDQSEDLSKVHHTVFQVLPPPKHLVEELNRAKRDLEYQVKNDAQTRISESIYETTVFSLTVSPGETKTIVLPVRDQPSDLSEARYVIITTRSASLEHRHADDATTLTTSTSWCAASQRAINAVGSTLYEWSAVVNYDFNGTTVDIWGHGGIPSSGWGWSFDYASWVVVNNNTARADGLSTGYFTHLTIGREYARVRFAIDKNGSCSTSGSLGTW